MAWGCYKPLMIVGAAGVLAMACGKDQSASTPTAEDSAGGEAAAGGEGQPNLTLEEQIEVATNDPAAALSGPSPWGATRAEQCKAPPHKAIDPGAKKAFDKGVRASASSDRSSARSNFESAVDADPNAYPALYNLGVLADRDGEESDAMDYYRRALRAQPDYAPAARGIATIELRRGDTTGAVRLVEPLARDFPTNLQIQALYAEVLVEARRYEEAWMAARKALRCDERFVPAMIALVKASRAQGRDELADSILAQAMAVDPRNAELQFLQGERLKDEPGRLRDAMTAYERAVQLRPAYAEARMALGIQLLAGGNYPLALSHFQAAEKLVPTLPAVHVNLGDAYRATRQWTESKRAYEQALKMDSDLPEAHFGLGLMYLTAGADFPNLDELAALEEAQDEFRVYRREMGPRLKRNDQSGEYLRDLDRMIKRTKRRIERDKERAKRDAERGTREEGATE